MNKQLLLVHIRDFGRKWREGAPTFCVVFVCLFVSGFSETLHVVLKGFLVM